MIASGRTAEPVSAATVAYAVAAPAPAAASAKAAPVKHFGFRELLSDLNPLQYIPVIGTLFRAITGEVVPEPMRDAGSMVVSTLITGPIGAAIDLGELVGEKLTGIDPEKIADRLLAHVGIGHKAAVAVAAAAAKPEVKATHQAVVDDAPAAWSHAQLAAYGVTADANGELKQGDLGGSDVLNGLELDKIRTADAVARYAAASTKAG